MTMVVNLDEVLLWRAFAPCRVVREHWDHADEERQSSFHTSNITTTLFFAHGATGLQKAPREIKQPPKGPESKIGLGLVEQVIWM